MTARLLSGPSRDCPASRRGTLGSAHHWTAFTSSQTLDLIKGQVTSLEPISHSTCIRHLHKILICVILGICSFFLIPVWKVTSIYILNINMWWKHGMDDAVWWQALTETGWSSSTIADKLGNLFTLDALPPFGFHFVILKKKCLKIQPSSLNITFSRLSK